MPQRSDPWPARKDNPRPLEEPKHMDNKYSEKCRPPKFEPKPGWMDGLDDDAKGEVLGR